MNIDLQVIFFILVTPDMREKICKSEKELEIKVKMGFA